MTPPVPGRCFRASVRMIGILAMLGLTACMPWSSRPELNLSFESRLRLAEAAAGEGRGASAARLSVLRDAATQRPRDTAIQTRFVEAAEQAGQFTEALATHRQLLEREGPNAPRLMAIGRLNLRTGDAAGAIQSYTAALRLAPQNGVAANGLGLAHDMAGDHATAQQVYRRSLASNPTDWALRSNLAMSLIVSGQSSQAPLVLADAEFSAGVPSHARHNLALALTANGEVARARRVLLAEMGPSDAQRMIDDMLAFTRWLERPVTAQATRVQTPPPLQPAAMPLPSVRPVAQP